MTFLYGFLTASILDLLIFVLLVRYSKPVQAALRYHARRLLAIDLIQSQLGDMHSKLHRIEDHVCGPEQLTDQELQQLDDGSQAREP